MNDESRVVDRPGRAADPGIERDRPVSPPVNTIEAANIDAPVAAERVGTVRPEQVERPQEQLVPLFSSELSSDLRAQWDTVQIGFVDDPQQAVRDADALVNRALKSLAETFADQRTRLDGSVDAGDETGSTTENLRLALRRYRSFFDRLLSL